jgi:hypothetical protein
MPTIAFRVLSRAAIVACLAFAGASPVLIAAPAQALCKQGGPNCAPPWNKHPSIKVDTSKGPKVSDIDPTVDPDCKYYGNCHTAKRSPIAPKKIVSGTDIRKR